MLKSKKIEMRQSEVREKLAHLAGVEQPNDDQLTEMRSLDAEYKNNEVRYRAAVIAEDTERRKAGEKLETREGTEWRKLVDKFELRQVALYLDEGKAFSGETQEIVREMRNKGSYRGVPVPLMALEKRVGETVASNVPAPTQTANIVDRLFPSSVAAQMGVQVINIGSGLAEYPVVTDGVTVSWATSETGDVGGPTQFKTANATLAPEHTMGAQMRITRRAMLQSAGLEGAIRRDLQAAIQAELDRVVFQGSASGEPDGVIAGAGGYGIASNSGSPDYGSFRGEIASFMSANAAAGPGDVRVLIHPDTWDAMDDAIFDSGSGITEYDRLVSRVANVAVSGNALVDDGSALLTTTAGINPVFVGLWGGVDLIRDPYTDAQSGGLRITGLLTCDVTVPRAAQLRVITGLGD